MMDQTRRSLLGAGLVAVPAALAGGHVFSSTVGAWQTPPVQGTDQIMDYLLRATRDNYRAAKAGVSPKDFAAFLRRQGANHEFAFVAAAAQIRQAQTAMRRSVKADPTTAIQQIVTSRDRLAASAKKTDGAQLPQLDCGMVQGMLAADAKYDLVEFLSRGRKAFDVLADRLDALANERSGYQKAAFVRREPAASAPQLPPEVYTFIGVAASSWGCGEWTQLAAVLALLATLTGFLPGLPEIFAIEAAAIGVGVAFMCA